MNVLLKNTALITFAFILQKLIAFIYFSVITKIIGVESTGEYFLALAIIMVVSVIGDAGVTTYLVREIAKNKNATSSLLRGVMALKAISIPIAVAILIISPIILGYDPFLTNLIWIGSFILIADSFSLTFYGILRGFQLLKYESLGMFIGQLLTLIAGIGLLIVDSNIIYLIYALIVGSLFNLLFSLFIIIRKIGFSNLKPDFSQVKTLFIASSAFFLAAIFTKVYSYIDSILLNHFLDTIAVGIYAISYKLTYAFQFLPMAFIAALYPAMSEVSDNANRLSDVFSKSIWYVSLISFPIVAGIFSLAEEIIILYSSIDFIEAVIPLQILIFVLLFIFLDFPLGAILNATGRQAKKTLVMGLTMILNLILNLILIPIIGVSGAALSGLLSFIFMFFADWLMMQDLVVLNLKDIFKISYPFMISSIIMGVSVSLLSNMLNLLIIIPIGAIIYILFIFIFGGIKKEHLDLIWKLKKQEQ